MDVFIEPRAQPYYDRLSADDAIVIAQEKIEEWDYAADPHGYCHDRSVLVHLLRHIEQLEARL